MSARGICGLLTGFFLNLALHICSCGCVSHSEGPFFFPNLLKLDLDPDRAHSFPSPSQGLPGWRYLSDWHPSP